MKEIRYKNIDRLINPSQIAFIGGADAEVAINEAKRRGFKGSIWPVNPKRDVENAVPIPDKGFLSESFNVRKLERIS